MSLDKYWAPNGVVGSIYTDAKAKQLCLQMLRGMAYLHKQGWMHRDMKPQNVLIQQDGSLKIGDYGLSCKRDTVNASAMYINPVCTLMFRPPEIMMQSKMYPTLQYDEKLDVWSTTLVVAWIFLRGTCYYLPYPANVDATTEHQQAGNEAMREIIWSICGTPHESQESEWPLHLQNYVGRCGKGSGSSLSKVREHWPNGVTFPPTPGLQELLHEMLQINPLKRPSIQYMIDHAFFKNSSNSMYPRPSLK